jgi:hypothetical protein
MYLNTAAMTGAMAVVKVTTGELHETTQHESKESKGSEGMGRDEISENQNTEENIEKGEQETKRRIDEEKVVGNKDTKEVHAQTGEDDAMSHQSTPFDWATDVDELMSPVPVMFPDRTPAEHTDYKPIMRADPIDILPSMSNQPAHVTTDNTPTVGVNPVTDIIPIASTLITCNDLSINPAPTVLATPFLPTIHGPHDLSGLRLGTKNPWGSIQCRRDHSYSARNWTALWSDS